jgi:HEAT repeat protein
LAVAVRRGADLLRNAAWDPADLRAFVERLATLAKDESARVRQSVAEAAPYLPEAVSRDILAPLAKDPSPFVRDAAERAERKRSALQGSRSLIASHAEVAEKRLVRA